MPEDAVSKDDRKLAQRVQQTLDRHDSLGRFEIEVVARNGDVSLHGRVDTLDQRSLVSRVVGAVEGVRNVHNEVVAGLHATEETDPELKTEG